MNEFIVKFNQTLGDGVAGTQRKLEALKTKTDLQKDKAEDLVGRYLIVLDDQITARSRKLEKLEEKIEDWVLGRSEKKGSRKEVKEFQSLIDRAAHAQRKSTYAFEKALHAIDLAEAAMLRSKIAHAKAGITIQNTPTELEAFLLHRNEC